MTPPRRRDRAGALLFYGSLAGLAALLLGPLVLAWLATSALLRPPWYQHPGPGRPLPPGDVRDPRTDFGLDYADVAFPTAGGATLRGWWIPAADARGCAVVLAGGGWSDRRSLLPLAPPLRAAGFSVLAFDYREHGQSDGSGRGASFGVRESADVAAAARWLRDERGSTRIGVVGYSLGGAAAILAAADGAPLDAVVASTPGTTPMDFVSTAPEAGDVPAWLRSLVARLLLWRAGAPLDVVVSLEAGPLHAVDRVAPRPLLVIQGRDDPVSSLAAARRLVARAAPPKQLLVVAGAEHLDVLDAAGGEAQRQILAFLARRLCPSAASPPRS